MSSPVPQSIISFILQHHEYFPKAKRKKKMELKKKPRLALGITLPPGSCVISET